MRKSGVFEGLTDWHSHILPGVDDGIQTIEDSIAVLKEYEALGVRKVWLTPHIMEDYPNTTTELKAKFNELKSVWTGNIELALAAENMLDSLFEQRLEAGDVLPIGDERNHLLVETSYYTPPYGMEDMLEKIKSKGFYPILAHPERYRYMEEADYRKLRNDGVFFQVNIMSFVGAYGEAARKKAEWLLSKDMIDILGSDVHRLSAFQTSAGNSPKKSMVINQLKTIKDSIKLS